MIFYFIPLSVAKTDLTEFLIQRASKNFELANFLFWFLQLESNEETPSPIEIRKMFEHVLTRFLCTLKHVSTYRLGLQNTKKNFKCETKALFVILMEHHVSINHVICISLK